jgi:hypothetical protein
MPTSADAQLVERVARRGPVPLPAADRRVHCVSVRLNVAELARLDERRGRLQRGEWLRVAALDQLPPTIPSANVQAWAELARLAGDLNKSQALIERGEADSHQAELLEDLRKAVASLRRKLVGMP